MTSGWWVTPIAHLDAVIDHDWPVLDAAFALATTENFNPAGRQIRALSISIGGVADDISGPAGVCQRGCRHVLAFHGR